MILLINVWSAKSHPCLNSWQNLYSLIGSGCKPPDHTIVTFSDYIGALIRDLQSHPVESTEPDDRSKRYYYLTMFQVSLCIPLSGPWY